MLAIRLSDDIETCLYSLAKKTGRAKTFYAREA
ncbi:CopG family transcriptional regulator, partial [Escherichia coli]|nr:CopG family transcriptional regulator [Escherichia coli]HBB3164631.1 CopG family transcriptional regulator [Escherichia coli]HBB3306141.1 CopG family transcriptional regulator [Escherichia coli]